MDKSYLDTVSKLYRKLADLQELKTQMEEDVKIVVTTICKRNVLNAYGELYIINCIES